MLHTTGTEQLPTEAPLFSIKTHGCPQLNPGEEKNYHLHATYMGS